MRTEIVTKNGETWRAGLIPSPKEGEQEEMREWEAPMKEPRGHDQQQEGEENFREADPRLRNSF